MPDNELNTLQTPPSSPVERPAQTQPQAKRTPPPTPPSAKTKSSNPPEDIDTVGFVKKEIDKFRQFSKACKKAHFIIPISLIDIDKRQDKEKFKEATLAKIAAYLVIVERFYPDAHVEFLIGDTLRSDSDSKLVESLKASWGNLFNLPIAKLNKSNVSTETSYLVQHTFPNVKSSQVQWNITLSSWEKYRIKSDAPDFMNKVRAKFSAIQELAKSSPDQAIDILADPTQLLSNAHLGEIREHFNQKIAKLLGLTDEKAKDFKIDEAFFKSFAKSAAHHIKKTHDIQLLGSDNKTASSNALDPDFLKTKHILSAIKSHESAINEFIDSFCYVLEETSVILDVLTRQAQIQQINNDELMMMLYASGFTDVPDFHPVNFINTFLSKANLPRYFMTGSGFQLQQPSINFSNNKQSLDLSNSSSNGSNSIMYQPEIKTEHINRNRSVNTDLCQDDSDVETPTVPGSTSNSSNSSVTDEQEQFDTDEQIALRETRLKKFEKLQESVVEHILDHTEDFSLCLGVLKSAQKLTQEKMNESVQRNRSTSTKITLKYSQQQNSSKSDETNQANGATQNKPSTLKSNTR